MNTLIVYIGDMPAKLLDHLLLHLIRSPPGRLFVPRLFGPRLSALWHDYDSSTNAATSSENFDGRVRKCLKSPPKPSCSSPLVPVHGISRRRGVSVRSSD
ncbi:hypothetical protein MPTK2_7g00750 [Marchantia polymorpha subsp. ruderalis]